MGQYTSVGHYIYCEGYHKIKTAGHTKPFCILHRAVPRAPLALSVDFEQSD